VNSGGEPERDDTGLPPVDIEIPDDARELDRDVQAYYREQRAERRRLRHRRLHRTIARDGIVLPLLACCLVLALIAGTLLTVFTATSDQYLIRPPGYGTSTSGPHSGGPGSSGPAASGPVSSGAASRPASSGGSAGPAGGALTSSPLVVNTGEPLPSGTLTIADSNRVLPLRSLGVAILVLVPRACRCGATVSWLAGIGARQGVRTYLVGTPQTISEVRQLHSGLTRHLQGATAVALDKQGVLAGRYMVRGLTAVLVTGRSMVTQSAAYAQNLSPRDNPARLVQALTG
jgi:hypothetical protein